MKMESNTHEASSIVKRSHYHSSLLLCFVVSVGICCSVLPIIPLEDSNVDSPRGDLTYIITRSCLAVFMIFLLIFFCYLVRKRDSFHREEEVFWPLRCLHCARAVGFHPKHTQNGKTHSAQRDLKLTPGHHLLLKPYERGRCGLSLPNESRLPLHNLGYERKISRSKSLENLKFQSCTNLDEHGRVNLCIGHRMDSFQNEENIGTLNLPPVCIKEVKDMDKVDHRLYDKPHTSLLKTFYIFGTIAAINIPVPIVNNIMCIVTLENSLTLNIVLVGQVLVDIIFMMMVVFAMLFFKNFYDAVFVAKKKFVFPFSVIFASGFWIALVKIIYPIGEMTTSTYGHHKYPCDLPGKFGIFANLQERALTPFYAECAIISAAMMWHIWYSSLPQSILVKTEGTSQFQDLGPTYVDPFWGKIRAHLRNICSRRMLKFKNLGSSKEEAASLLPITNGGKDKTLNFQELPLNVTLSVAFLIFLGIAYLLLSEVFDHSDLGLEGTPSSTNITLTYLKWFLQTVFYLPLLALYRYLIFLTDSAKSFRIRENVSLVSGLIGGHDRILLISCIGTFTLNIFRFVSALGILMQTSRPHEDIVLACYTGAFAVFQSYSAWVMTSFLVAVQRQAIRGTAETKWTLICIIYTGVLNITKWVIDSVEIKTWIELTSFYGPTQGMVIGVLLEPLTSLYGIHSATIAYEAYKTISSDFQSRRKSTTGNDNVSLQRYC